MIIKMQDEKPWYAELEFESFKEFLHWKIDQVAINFDGFIFRGHSRGSYKLIPSALRKDKDTGFPLILKYHPTGCHSIMIARNWENIIRSEYNLLTNFYKEANKQGLAVPINNYISNNYFMRYNNEYFDNLKTWYDKDMCALASLAQHYKLPTQMLDWTFNIDVAFYFALEGIVKDLFLEKDIEKKFNIWGVRAEYIIANYDDFDKECRCPIKFYVPNYIGNKHIKQQKGLLTYREIFDFQSQQHSQYDEKPFDGIFLDYFEKINTKRNITEDGVRLFKMTFPTDRAVSEFKMLSENGYNAASIFSEYEGVIQKLKEDEWIKKLL